MTSRQPIRRPAWIIPALATIPVAALLWLFVNPPTPRRTYPPVDPTSVYATQIQPVLKTHCVSCHSPAKRKGGLELDTYAGLMDGGHSGIVIVEGHPETSILFTRITLPPTDKRFMPSDHKLPLTPQEIALIQTWIQQGASPLAPHAQQQPPLQSSEPVKPR